MLSAQLGKISILTLEDDFQYVGLGRGFGFGFGLGMEKTLLVH